MSLIPKSTGGRIVLLVALQTLVLMAILADRAVTLMTGHELVVKTVPVDPRDIFRGDYVALNYEISRIEVGRLEGDRQFLPGDRVYVTLKPEGDDWVAETVSHRPPAATSLAPEDRFLRATVDYVYEAPERTGARGGGRECPAPCTTVTLKYGIESYFVPEGTGRALEEARNDERVSVVLAVRPNGRAAIKALKLDGKILAREGLL